MPPSFSNCNRKGEENWEQGFSDGVQSDIEYWYLEIVIGLKDWEVEMTVEN